MIQGLDLNKSPIKIKRALLSVYDKSNIVELAHTLNKKNIEILSTGGTAKALRQQNPILQKIPQKLNLCGALVKSSVGPGCLHQNLCRKLRRCRLQFWIE